MGYYTEFALSWKPADKYKPRQSCPHLMPMGEAVCPVCGMDALPHRERDFLHNVVEESVSRLTPLKKGEDKFYVHDIKWYDHEKDMLKVSLKIPDVIFILHGEGEDRYDVWDKAFLNGKIQVSRLEVTMPGLDPMRFDFPD